MGVSCGVMSRGCRVLQRENAGLQGIWLGRTCPCLVIAAFVSLVYFPSRSKESRFWTLRLSWIYVSRGTSSIGPLLYLVHRTVSAQNRDHLRFVYSLNSSPC